MQEGKRRVVVVLGDEDGVFEALPVLSNRSALEVHKRSNGKSGITLCADLWADRVIIVHPLPDLTLHQFAAGLRLGFPSEAVPQVLVIAEEAGRISLGNFADESFSFVKSTDDPSKIEDAIARFLGMERRAAARMLVELDVILESGRMLRACQTDNVSETGMLLRTAEADALPVGTAVILTVSLPDDSDPVRATAVVARHTNVKAENLKGVGLRFTQFEKGSEDRLQSFLRSLSEES